MSLSSVMDFNESLLSRRSQKWEARQTEDRLRKAQSIETTLWLSSIAKFCLPRRRICTGVETEAFLEAL